MSLAYPPKGSYFAKPLRRKMMVSHTTAGFVISNGCLELTYITTDEDSSPCIYLTSHGIGLQPKRTPQRIEQYLQTWRTQAYQGHRKDLMDSPLPVWGNVDWTAAKMMAPLVGANTDEVAVMQSLTVNLHLLMAAFYKPDKLGRYKIIIESQSFPSDHVC